MSELFILKGSVVYRGKQMAHRAPPCLPPAPPRARSQPGCFVRPRPKEPCEDSCLPVALPYEILSVGRLLFFLNV